MLAWVHQSIAGEREFLDGLFDVKGDGRMVGSVRVFGKTEEEDWIRELMDKAFEKLRTPLKVGIRYLSYCCVGLIHQPSIAFVKLCGRKRVV